MIFSKAVILITKKDCMQGKLVRTNVQGETELSFRLIPFLAKITSSLTVLVLGFV